MANHASAEKASRQSIKRRERNRAARATLRTAIKGLRSAIESGNAEEVRRLLPATLSRIDKGAKKGLLHDNAADRHKARLQAKAQRVLSGKR